MSDFCSVLGSGYLASACRSLFYSGNSQGTSRCGWLYGKALDEEPKDAGTDAKTDAPRDKGPDSPKDSRYESLVDLKVDGPGCKQPITPTLLTKSLSTIDDFTLPNTGMILERTGIKCYKAKDGVLPNAALPAWTLEPASPPAGSYKLTTDTTTNEAAVEMDSTSFNDVLNWGMNLSTISNSVKWCVQSRQRVESSSTHGHGSSQYVADGTKTVILGFTTSEIKDVSKSSVKTTLNSKLNSNTVLFCGMGSNYSAYVNSDIYKNNVTLSGTGQLTLPSTSKFFKWGDNGLASGVHAHAFFNHACYIENYTGFTSKGTITLIYDLGTTNNNLGSGAIGQVDKDIPSSSTNITIKSTRSGNTPTPDSGWSSATPLKNGGEIQSPPRRYLEIVAELSTSDPNVSPLFKGIKFVSLCGL